jgi:hypothetical protein
VAQKILNARRGDTGDSSDVKSATPVDGLRSAIRYQSTAKTCGATAPTNLREGKSEDIDGPKCCQGVTAKRQSVGAGFANEVDPTSPRLRPCVRQGQRGTPRLVWSNLRKN